MFGSTNWKCLKFTHAILEAKARRKTHTFCSGLIFFLLFLWNIAPLPHPFTLVFFPEIKYCRIRPNALRQFLSDEIVFINKWHNFFSQEFKMQSEERWRDRGNSVPSPCLTSLVHRGVWQCTFYSGSIVYVLQKRQHMNDAADCCCQHSKWMLKKNGSFSAHQHFPKLTSVTAHCKMIVLMLGM